MELREREKDARALKDIAAWSTIADIDQVKALCETTKHLEIKCKERGIYVHTDKYM